MHHLIAMEDPGGKSKTVVLYKNLAKYFREIATGIRIAKEVWYVEKTTAVIPFLGNLLIAVNLLKLVTVSRLCITAKTRTSTREVLCD